MVFEDFVEGVSDSCKRLYTIKKECEESDCFEPIVPESFINGRVIKIKRSDEIDTWKTILITEIESLQNRQDLIDWVVEVKQSLKDPESADLYLFLMVSETVDIEECIRFESTEQFCRKYVLQQDEDVVSFTNRTFLQCKFMSDDGELDEDPIEKALNILSTDYKWFDYQKREVWKKVLLEKSGSDSAYDLLLDGEES